MTNWLKRLGIALVFMLAGGAVLAQDVTLATVTRKPFSHVEDGTDTGFSIDLWARIA